MRCLLRFGHKLLRLKKLRVKEEAFAHQRKMDDEALFNDGAFSSTDEWMEFQEYIEALKSFLGKSAIGSF